MHISEMAARASRQEIPGGVRLTVPAERTTTVVALALAEQECCPFLDLRFHLDGPLLHLQVRAPGAAAGFLDELFPPTR